MWGQEVWTRAYLTPAPGGGNIRKKETSPGTLWTRGWVSQKGSIEAIERVKFSLPCPESNPNPSINQPFTLLIIWQPVSSHYIKASRTFKNISFKYYKILNDNNTIFFPYGSQVQILTENNTEKSKTSPQTAIEITILRSKIGIKILQGN